MAVLGMRERDLGRQRKESREKSLLAWLLQERTAVKQTWIAQRLKMGASSSVGTCAKRVRDARDAELSGLRKALEKC